MTPSNASRGLRWSAALLVLCWLLHGSACARPVPPRFAGDATIVVPKANAQNLAFSQDGFQWLVVGAPDEFLIASAAGVVSARHKIANARIISGGWLDGARVFIAYQAFGATLGEGSENVVEFWDATKDGSVAKAWIPEREPPASTRLVAVSRTGRYAAQGSAVYDLEAARWVRDSAPHAGQNALELREDWILTASHHDEQILLRSLVRDETHTWRAPDRVTAATMDTASTVYVGTLEGVCAFFIARPTGTCVRLGQVRDLKVFDSGLAALGERQVWLLEARTLRERAAIRLPSRPTVLATDGPLVAVGDQQGNVTAWDGIRAEPLAEQKALAGPVTSIAVSHRARIVLAAALIGGDSQVARLGIAATSSSSQ